MKLLCLQHVSYEGPARIVDWAATRGHHIEPVHLYAGDPIPAADAYDALVVMGGPMSVHDEAEHPWLAEEKQAIRAALDAGRKVLGMCLGGQLIAHILGADVQPHTHKEIGWFDLAWTDAGRAHPLTAGLPEPLIVCHWHGDRFEIPEGATHLAKSRACDTQAFVWNDQALALQFHLEFTPASVEALVTRDPDGLKPGPWVQTPGQILAGAEHCAALQPHMFTLLDRFLG